MTAAVEPDEREHEQHEIGRPPSPRLAARRGEDLQPAGEKLGWSVDASIGSRVIAH